MGARGASQSRTTRFRVIGWLVVTSLLALAIGGPSAGPALATGGPPGNNGTIKIHEQGTPAGTESNDPKVCVFNVEGYGFDVGQRGYLMFTVQGGDSPTGTNSGPHNFGPTTASAEHRSYYETRYFTLKPGHYKATLYGKKGDTINLKDVKAKSKVFKVRCEEGGQQPSSPPATTPPPSNPPSSAPPSSAAPSTPTPIVAPTSGGATPTPTAAPTGGSGSETATPEPTLPPTDILAGSAQPSPEAWRLVLVAIAGLLSGILVLTPNRRRR
ncbi:MAG: hypothetical protein WEF51_02455 [Chloroflexota bacterium]